MTSEPMKDQDKKADEPGSGEAKPAQTPAEAIDLKEQVVDVMRTIFDPEIPVNVYELGLVYDIEVRPPGDVVIKMTLTSPMCPVAGSLPPEVESKVRALPGVSTAKVDLVWDPPWNPSMMSEAAKLQLNMF